MTRALRPWLMTALLGVVAGCGGGESGPRGNNASGAGGTGAMAPVSRPTLRTVAYLPSYHGALATWSWQLAFENVSYVNLSFADVDVSGNVGFPDAGLTRFVETAHAAGVKVCIALGGATTIADGGVFATLLEDVNRSAFIDKLMQFTQDNQLDCVDIDLEGNGVNQFYEALVVDLAGRLKPQGKELTAAVAGWFGDRISDRALSHMDFVNVMAYDLYSDISKPDQYASIEAATRSVDQWAARLPKEKVVYGVPFYGMQWPTAGGMPKQVAYGDLLRIDSMAKTQDQLRGTGTITYLNSRATIQAKALLAKNYGGVMIWEAGQDASGEESLLQAIRDAVP